MLAQHLADIGSVLACTRHQQYAPLTRYIEPLPQCIVLAGACTARPVAQQTRGVESVLV